MASGDKSHGVFQEPRLTSCDRQERSLVGANPLHPGQCSFASFNLASGFGCVLSQAAHGRDVFAASSRSSNAISAWQARTRPMISSSRSCP